LSHGRGSDADTLGAFSAARGSGAPWLRLLGLAVLLAGVFAAVLGASIATAATTYKSTGSFGNGTLSGNPTKIAVDNSTGNIIVADSPNNRVAVFDSGGPSAVLLAEIGVGELSGPFGVAVDQTSHAVYVTDSGNNRIVKYTSNGANPPVYTPVAFLSPGQGSEAGQVQSFASPIAVDPTNGDLLIADSGAQRVSRFTSGGGIVSSFNGADSSGGPFVHLLDVAVDAAGNTYVVDLVSGEISFAGVIEGSTRVEQFSPAGVSKGAFGSESLSKSRSITVDSKTGNVIVATQGEFEGLSALHVFHNGSLLAEFAYPEETRSAAAVGLAVDGGSSGRLYALTTRTFFENFGISAVQAYDPVALPDVVLNPASEVTATSAHLSGTVNPRGVPASYRFEYSPDGGASWNKTPVEEAGSGEAPVPATFDLTELAPNTEYLVRLVGINEAGSLFASDELVTLIAPPAVVTGSATDRTTTGATLRGTVNPLGLQTTYHFEYGPSTAYGSRAPASHDAVAGKGRKPFNVVQGIGGLQPETTYHYRLAAENAAGNSVGEDQTFSTGAAGGPQRVYEMVSPVDKGESDVSSLWAHASADGDAVSFQTQTAMSAGGLSGSAPYFPRYTATRSSSDWSTVGLTPPLVQSSAIQNFFFDVLAVSEDNSHAVVISPKALAPGAVENDSNLYLRDIATGAYTTIGTTPGVGYFDFARLSQGSGAEAVIGGTPSFSSVVFDGMGHSFLPGVIGGSVYEWSAGELRLVSNPGEATGNGRTRSPHRVSEDGSTIYYGRNHEVFAHVGSEDVAVSVGIFQEFVGATTDGRYSFTTAKAGLEGSNLYRYDLVARELELLTSNIPTLSAGLQASDNGEYVYFLASPNFPATDGLANAIWVWHNGDISKVATITEKGVAHWMASPGGRYLAFGTDAQLTAYKNDGAEEIYRYDAVTEEVTCASCRPDGQPPTGAASIGEEQAFFDHHFPRSMLDNGEVFFDTPDPLVLADGNSTQDVYSFDGVEAALISAGAGSSASRFADASADGEDVFFTTQDRLVKQDTDSAGDLYDARLGGGIAAQNAEPPDSSCSGEGCRGAAAGAPAPPVSGSEAMKGPGDPSGRTRRHCRKGQSRVRSKGKSRCLKQPKKHDNRRQSR
jgi:DNA-binding beta-propeller fold protein YncE